MELDMMFRLSLLVGFLIAGFLILFIAAIIVGVCAWHKFLLKDVFQELDELEKIEEGMPHGNEH